MIKSLKILVIALMTLSSCASDPENESWDKVMGGVGNNNALHHKDDRRSSSYGSDRQLASSSAVVVPGNGKFVNETTGSISHETLKGGGQGYTLNLVDAPIAEAAKQVLGDILGYNYLVDPRVEGKITLQTSNPVSKDMLVEILETSLAVNGAAIVKRNGRFDIVPQGEAARISPEIDVSNARAAGPGVRLKVIQLRYIGAAEMKEVLEPIAQGSIVRIDEKRNYIVVSGNAAELNTVQEAVTVFDVDYMKGMSVGLYPLKTARPSSLVQELYSVFGFEPNTKIIRFIPNERLNSVMAITSRQEYLPKVAAWIRKLDRVAETNDEQLFVYEVQNRPVTELASIIQAVVVSGGEGMAPNLTPVVEGSSDGGAAMQASMPLPPSVPRIVADTEKNALLISTTPREYRRIEAIIRQLDVVPTQVFLEAIIAEVTLNDELKFGLNWYFEQGRHDSYSLVDTNNGIPMSAFPGFSWAKSAQGIQATLNALSGMTKVKIISSPHLMVVNNQKATLQVGDQVPIVTQSSAEATSNTAIVNSVELKDTGIILSVTPRINSAGRVMLDIEQEVSDVVPTTTSGIDSPTIQQRKLSTRVVVTDGESIALGGLIQEKKSQKQKKVPVLGDIPGLGNAFKSKSDTTQRTELVIFIRPQVIKNTEEAREATDEFRAKMDFGRSDTPSRRMKKDLKRLVE